MRWFRTVCGAALAATLCLGPAGTAGAAGHTGGPGSTTVGGSGATTTVQGDGSDLEAAGAYWTPERMAAAVTAEAGREAAARSAAGLPAAADGATADGAAADAAKSSANRTVGRVFYTNPVTQQDGTCSAGAISSPSRMMVVTAGHCIVTGGSGYHGQTPNWFRTRWIYVPAYNGADPYPYGFFTMKRARAFVDWVDDASPEADVAFVTVNPNAQGQKVVDATGANALTWNQTAEVSLTAYGYPGNVDNGEYQVDCTRTIESRVLVPLLIEMPCNLIGQGASGGPWLWTDPKTFVTSVNGVTSTYEDGRIFSPYFNDNVHTMWLNQGSVT
ncbi:trypsin-like serine peptidase [Kitasatospora sp. NPDC059327]|uniref:trypsin-like serine peptidase n=1 Tax=Kitasatospora sp. NPDC059327 TaxID=3346803 RepID=UPI00367F57AC